MLAALCDMPQGTFAFKLDIIDGRAIVGREIDGGEQTLSLSLPAVISTDLRLNEPRYAKLPDIMKARKKPLETLVLEDLGLALDSRLSLLAVKEPAKRSAGILLKDSAELIDKLKNEAKVLP